MSDKTFVRLQVQNPEDRQQPTYEDVPAVRDGDGSRFLIRASPILVENVAKGDVLSVAPDGTFTVIFRSGNVCVQYLRTRDGSRESGERTLIREVSEMGGTLDATHPGALSFSIPLQKNGFQRIEQAFDAATASCPGSSWMYGNIYDPKTSRPLNWWVKSDSSHEA